MTITRNSRPTSVKSTSGFFQCTAIVAALFATTATADSLLGPFVPGTGQWDTWGTIGSFEPGPGGSWQRYSSRDNTGVAVGGADVNTDDPIVGAWSAFIVCSNPTFGVPNMGVSGSRTYTIPADSSTDEFVLSGFIERREGTSTTANFGLHVSQTGNFDHTALSIPGTSTTQFVWTGFTVTPGSDVVVSWSMDGTCVPGDFAYFDEIALTPLSEFVLPTPVPEPVTTTLAGAVLLSGCALWRSMKRRRYAGQKTL
jgi:hypothetical protein